MKDPVTFKSLVYENAKFIAMVLAILLFVVIDSVFDIDLDRLGYFLGMLAVSGIGWVVPNKK